MGNRSPTLRNVQKINEKEIKNFYQPKNSSRLFIIPNMSQLSKCTNLKLWLFRKIP